MNQRTFTWKEQRKIIRKQNSYKNKKEKNTETIKKKNKNPKEITKEEDHPKKDTKRIQQNINKINECNNKNKKYRKEIKKLKEEDKLYEECNTKISEFFQTDTLNCANRKFNTLYNRKQYLPPKSKITWKTSKKTKTNYLITLKMS